MFQEKNGDISNKNSTTAKLILTLKQVEFNSKFDIECLSHLSITLMSVEALELYCTICFKIVYSRRVVSSNAPY